MLFRRYRTWFIAIIILGLAGALAQVLPYLQDLPRFQGVPQGNGASYPLRSADRALIDLNGTWQAYPSLGSAKAAFAPSPQSEVYGVGKAVYATVNPANSIQVPGSWTSQVAAKQFFLGNELAGMSFRLHFLGTGGKVQVYVNGFSRSDKVGTEQGGSIPFEMDIPAPRLRFGQVNTIAVKLERPDASGPWLHFPGLTGEVYLEAVGPVVLDSPRVATKLNGSGAEVDYSIPVDLQRPEDVLNGQVNLLDAGGNVIAGNSFSIKPSGQTRVSGSLTLPQARLWSPSDPYLYQMAVVIDTPRGERDSYSFPVGLRTVKFAGNDLILNGNKLAAKILVRVTDAPAAGGASDPATAEADIKWAKAQGYNVLYLPDRPPQPYLLDLADRYGLLVLSQYAADGGLPQNGGKGSGQVLDLLGFHPSFLAQGLGANLDLQDSGVKAYLAMNTGPQFFYTALGKPDSLIFTGGGELKLNAPYLADFLAVKPSFHGSGYVATHLDPAGILTRARGQKGQSAAAGAKPDFPPLIPVLAGAVSLFLALRSWQVGNLRFAHLAEANPKRKLRGQIKLQAYWLLLRLAVLALIPADAAARWGSSPLIDYLIEQIPMDWLRVLCWYLLANPWAMFLTIFSSALILSMLQAWPRARSLPGKPGTVGVLLWLEKRKRWIMPVIAVWILAQYGAPYGLVPMVMVFGCGLSRFAVSKDVRWAGGKTFDIVYFAGLGLSLLIIFALNWELFIYMYHWAKLGG